MNHALRVLVTLLAVAMASPSRADVFTIQPGPADGKDTYFGTVYEQDGRPDLEEMSIGGWGDYYYDFLEFNLAGSPPSSQIGRVNFMFYVTDPRNDPVMRVYRITQPWTEAGVTSVNHPTSTFFTPVAPLVAGWNSVDITSLYQGWKNGTLPNYGIELVPTVTCCANNGHFAASENRNCLIRPKLEITYAPPTPNVISGTVFFEDCATPVIGAQVVIQGLVELYTADVDANGHYSFRGDQIPPFNPLGYTIFARYRIPTEFTFSHPGGTYQEVAVQPYDLDTAADLTVGLSGDLSRSRFDFVFPWPVILLHGILKFANSGFGPDHFNGLQPYLANPVTLQTVRRGFIPFVPDMGSARVGADQHLSRPFDESYDALLPQVRRIFRLFPPQTKFSLVCYSQGGLVARRLIDAVTNNVIAATHISKVIEYGTPNSGSCVAGVACPSYAHFCPLSVARMLDFNFGDGMTLVPHNYLGARQSLPGSQVPLYLIAGGRFRRIDPSRLGFNNSCLEDPGNAPMGSDSVTPVHSVFVLSSLGYNTSQARMVTLPLEDHLSLPDSQDVITQVYRWLLDGSPLR